MSKREKERIPLSGATSKREKLNLRKIYSCTSAGTQKINFKIGGLHILQKATTNSGASLTS
jgi:hypothetical protein